MMPTPPSPLVVASILGGVPAALWAYKCAMMVLFQRKIIYMGYAPLGARTDRLADVPRSQLHGLSCSELHIPSSHKPISALLVRPSSSSDTTVKLVILYLQGNAGNPLHRLPVFQSLLAASPTKSTTILAPAPRSYWSSPGRPTQHGILSDYTHSLTYVLRQYPRARVVLYGHSLGGAIALCVLAQPSLARTLGLGLGPDLDAAAAARIAGVVLENPVASVPHMLRALYPQPWLPYRHLAPFVWDRWDALRALYEVRTRGGPPTLLERLCTRMLVLASENDEVVPKEMGRLIAQTAMGEGKGYSASDESGDGIGEETGDRTGVGGDNDESPALRTRYVVVRGALHEDAWNRKGWAEAVGPYLRGIIDETRDSSAHCQHVK